MTTSVTVKHEGPSHMDVLVERVNPKTGENSGGKRLVMGESVEYNIYDTQVVMVSEVPAIKLKA